LPLPKHINEKKVTETIDYRKDVDGFHPMNVGLMFKGLPCFLPATPFGIVKLIEHYNIETNGKHCVVIGRSDIVGKPMSALMLQKNCTVTVCHSRTVNIEEHIKRADIVIAAVGIPEYVKAHMIKDGAVVIDVGITRVEDASTKSGYRLKGDVAYEECAAKASYITTGSGRCRSYDSCGFVTKHPKRQLKQIIILSKQIPMQQDTNNRYYRTKTTCNGTLLYHSG